MEVAFLDGAHLCARRHPPQLHSEQAGPMPDPSLVITGNFPATLLKDFLNRDWILP